MKLQDFAKKYQKLQLFKEKKKKKALNFKLKY